MDKNKHNEEPKDSLQNEDFDLSHFSEEEEGTAFTLAKKFGILIFEVVKVVVISLAIILPIRMFLVQPFYVEGASMEPNFYQNEYLVIDELSYRFNAPERGQVIIFKNPQNTRNYFIKRIIGLPGETVEIKDGHVYINEAQLEEKYIEHVSADSHSPITLANNEFFVMGDNRVNSFDSRQLGPIKQDYFIGRVWFRGWPLDRVNTFNLPEYNN